MLFPVLAMKCCMDFAWKKLKRVAVFGQAHSLPSITVTRAHATAN